MLRVASLLFFFMFKNVCDSANILAVFPTPSISHQIVFRPVMHELAKRGHQVTVITPDPAFPKGQTPQNLTEIDVHDISYKIWEEFVTSEKGHENNAPEQIKFIFQILNSVFYEQVKSLEVQELIFNKKKTFDLLFIETCVRPAISFSYIYNVPVIQMSSLGGIYETFEPTGAPTNGLVYPLPTRKKLMNLTIWERISELRSEYKSEQVYEELLTSEDKMLKKIFGPNIPDIRELQKNIQMLYLNVHPIWDFNRPVPPNIIYLGGLHQHSAKKLPQELQSYLDSSKNGVIYMSFGTNVKPSLLPAEKIQIFANVFSKLPYNILWKWNTDVSPGKSENVNISKWFPQSDLLKHPNVKLFITQGGLQSTDEAITAGVPLLGVPMLGDQWFNVEQYVRLNIGMRLSLETLTEEILKNAIENIINNKSYRQNIMKLRDIMHDQPQTPLERAVWWTEHILKHGDASHLQSVAANMHWTEYYAIDIVLLSLSFLVIILILTVFSIQFIMSKMKYIQFKTKIH